MRQKLLGLVSAIALVTLVGCGGSASVTGVVTANGETVDGGSIVFKPIEAGIKPALGKIGADGSYMLQVAGGDGVAPGNYQVIYMPPDQKEDESGRAIGPPIKWRAFQAPREPVTVEATENNIAIELSKR